jgi:hypothetical protein
VSRHLNKITSSNHLFNFFSPDGKDFVDEVGREGFQLEGKLSLFSTRTWAAASGEIISHPDKIIINVNVYTKYVYFHLVSLGIFSLAFASIGLSLAVASFIDGKYELV